MIRNCHQVVTKWPKKVQCGYTSYLSWIWVEQFHWGQLIKNYFFGKLLFWYLCFNCHLPSKFDIGKHEVKTTIITAAEGTHPSSLWWEQCTYDILQDKGYISVSVHEQIFEASQVAVKMFQDSWNWSVVASLAEYAWHAMGKSRPENWIFRKKHP